MTDRKLSEEIRANADSCGNEFRRTGSTYADGRADALYEYVDRVAELEAALAARRTVDEWVLSDSGNRYVTIDSHRGALVLSAHDAALDGELPAHQAHSWADLAGELEEA